MALIYDVFEAPGAALPSSHVAASICTVWFSFRYRLRVRHLHLVAVILLCLSTIYCRYHYVIDVLAGLLTIAVLLPLGNQLFNRYHEPRSTSKRGRREPLRSDSVSGAQPGSLPVGRGSAR